MEGLLFFIVMAVFIGRLMKKIKKPDPRGEKKGNKPVEKPKPHPYKDKLEEMIRNMEEAEKLKKEEPVPDHREESSDEVYRGEEETTEYYGDEAEADRYSEEAEDLPAGRIKQPAGYSNGMLSKSSVTPPGKTAPKSILASLSKYPEFQRAVVYKEILDSPVSDKY